MIDAIWGINTSVDIVSWEEQMQSLDDVCCHVRRTADDAPSVPGFLVQCPVDVHDDATMVSSVLGEGVRHIELVGVAVAIDYVDAKEQETSRRITLRRVSVYDGGRVVWKAFCHERRALRTFVCDRIRCVVDMDGVVHDNPALFLFTELGVDVTLPVSSVQDPHASTLSFLGAIAFGPCGKVLRDGLTVLAGLAHADGLMDDAEVGVMLDYAANVIEVGGGELAVDGCSVLAGWIRRLRPEREAVDSALRSLAADAAACRTLLRFAVRLMDADGIQNPAEFDLVVAVQDSIQ
ncbi:hypothetical protein HEQ62_04360 [Haematospirillum jordaniae]|uniref:tellurite resistance TerB family protein n=1 Tax=Haematospirillum jordaniae TaxID=1549855 RepID=UPI0012E8252E|nr:hypothetical protein [Haematospirillum jordaniae]NKD45446.1 hypothetical protein [Haematospirillum jordaniae]NKD56831.1 hypothetical protein [Haematospirillum jordaniae]NKD59013.1 hypothetical protein [Haematospirillum jordaniae]NKD66756.1 hypothetical protein [Haematospirillum jordaniae]NKD79015.1 hypothetical protein [Haematospirillum jordaniae]